MQLKSAIALYLESKKRLTSHATYKSCSKYLQVTVNLDTIDLAGDLLSSERKRRIRKTKDIFKTVEDKLQGKSQNTKFFTLTMLKSVLKMVEDTDGSRFWNSYTVSQEKKDIVILDIDFAKAFVTDRTNVYGKLSPELKAVWELSAVMLTTTLRISDALTLTPDKLKDNRITVKNKKTGVVTSCPIPETLADKLMDNILHGSIYTCSLSKDKAYELLPELLSIYPEMKDKTHLRFHVFRKTAISLMLAMGVSQSIVMRASGHSVGSKAFARYVGHVETVFNTAINDFQAKLYS